MALRALHCYSFCVFRFSLVVSTPPCNSRLHCRDLRFQKRPIMRGVPPELPLRPCGPHQSILRMTVGVLQQVTYLMCDRASEDGTKPDTGATRDPFCQICVDGRKERHTLGHHQRKSQGDISIAACLCRAQKPQHQIAADVLAASRRGVWRSAPVRARTPGLAPRCLARLRRRRPRAFGWNRQRQRRV